MTSLLIRESAHASDHGNSRWFAHLNRKSDTSPIRNTITAWRLTEAACATGPMSAAPWTKTKTGGAVAPWSSRCRVVVVELAGVIRGRCIAWAVGEASVEEIDRLNIYWARMLAMSRAVEALGLYRHDDAVQIGAGPWLHVPVGKLRQDRYLPLHPHLVGRGTFAPDAHGQRTAPR